MRKPTRTPGPHTPGPHTLRSSSGSRSTRTPGPHTPRSSSGSRSLTGTSRRAPLALTGRALTGKVLTAMALTTLTTSCYLAGQGYHLVSHQLAAQPVEKLRTAHMQSLARAHPDDVRDPHSEPTPLAKNDGRAHPLTPEELAFFDRVDNIRTYATDTLGLTAGDNYRRYVPHYKHPRDHLVDVVSAVEATSFTRKEWRFPIVGKVPYKGFYNPKKAQKLAATLKQNGWDVVVRPVTAFSTLGYFKDPLYSFMVTYNDARLADLIIHEMAHATLWVPDESQFNEEFATFVGQTGAMTYLIHHYGPESPEVTQHNADRHDSTLFLTDILTLRSQLETLYTTAAATPDTAPDRAQETLTQKEQIIAAFQTDFARTYTTRYLTDTYRTFPEISVNNAWIDLYHTYGAGLPTLDTFHRRVGHNDLRRTVQIITTLMKDRANLPRSQRPAPLETLQSHPEFEIGN